jgi:hypothetical protein
MSGAGCMRWLSVACAFAAAAAFAAEPAAGPNPDAPANRTDAVNAAAPAPAVTTRPFGVAPEGLTSPELTDAVQKMDAASVLPGSRGSITRMRWSSEQPPKLWFVGLWGPNIDNALISLSAHTPDLWSVELHEPHIDDQGMRSLARLPKLRYLKIDPIERWSKPGFTPLMYCFPGLPPRTDRPRVTGKSLVAFADASALEGLSLLDTVIAAEDLAALARIPKLSSVALPCVIDETAVGHLKACRRLNSLTLGYREVTAEEIKRLAGWKSLRSLTITNATLPDDALSAFESLPAITSLELTACGITDTRLAHLRLPPMVTTLSLRQNPLTGPGLAALGDQPLKTLALEYTDLSDDTLAVLPRFKTLDNLFLEYCERITDQGIRSGALQSMTHLRELRLRGMKQVSDASLDDLVKFGHLKTISVRGAGVSWDGVARMKEAMPETFVFK